MIIYVKNSNTSYLMCHSSGVSRSYDMTVDLRYSYCSYYLYYSLSGTEREKKIKKRRELSLEVYKTTHPTKTSSPINHQTINHQPSTINLHAPHTIIRRRPDKANTKQTQRTTKGFIITSHKTERLERLT